MARTVLLAALVGAASAFPAAVLNHPLEKFDFSVISSGYKEKRQAFGVNVGFDAKAQYVSTSGPYAFVAPTASDIRGPCPGLNALANHVRTPYRR